MLVSFSVANFRSFSKEQTLSLVASSRLAGSHDGHTVLIPDSDQHVLRVGVLYGPTGLVNLIFSKHCNTLKLLLCVQEMVRG